MRRLRNASIPLALSTISLTLGCNLVPQAPVPDFLPVGPSQPSPSQPAGAQAESPSASEAPSGESSGFSGEFVESDCACADYQPSQVTPWGNSGLICRYDWSGPNIDQNSLGFSVSHYYHTDRLQPDFEQNVEDLTASLPPQATGDDKGRQLRSDDQGYGYVVYGPGGGGNQGDIPLCGNGRGVYQFGGEFLIETDLFACDLPYSDNAYVSALTDMENCALRAIERIRD
jgi:hypothetical protein